MPIVAMLPNDLDTYPDGAHCVVPGKGHGWDAKPKLITSVLTGKPTWTGVLVLAETHVGLCLAKSEHNMRDDSDFYMTVWNPETGKAERIMFATTRGWSYPCLGSRVDATPEVRAAHAAWCAEEQRKAAIKRRWEQRSFDAAMAAHLGLSSRADVARLRTALGQRSAIPVHALKGSIWYTVSEDFRAVANLLAARKLRSEFRISLANQVRSWLALATPKHGTPLSPKQLQYIR